METSRIQLALNVSDIESATRFYTDFFGVGPAKQRAGYANFEIADPLTTPWVDAHALTTSTATQAAAQVQSLTPVKKTNATILAKADASTPPPKAKPTTAEPPKPRDRDEESAQAQNKFLENAAKYARELGITV